MDRIRINVMLISKISCELCGRQFKAITHTHLVKEHDMSLKDYMNMFPDSPLYEQVLEGEPDNKGLLLDALHKNWNR